MEFGANYENLLCLVMSQCPLGHTNSYEGAKTVGVALLLGHLVLGAGSSGLTYQVHVERWLLLAPGVYHQYANRLDLLGLE